jgi:hypothetical protein
MYFVIVTAHHVIDGFHAIDQGLSGELHSHLLDHANRSGVGRVGAGVDSRQLDLL